MRLRELIAVLLVAASSPAQPITVRVTGEIQSRSTSTKNFGHLPKRYRAADWTITSESPAPLKISVARIAQDVTAGPGITILSRTSSISVVADAQGRNPVNTVARVGTGAIGAIAASQALKVLPAAGGWGGTVILGAELATLAIQYILPTLPTHAVRSIGDMLPETLNLDPFGTATGVVIVELDKGTTVSGKFDQRLTLQSQ